MTCCLIDNAIFSHIQLEALKNQIFAFKLLSRDMPIPQHIMQAVLRPLPCTIPTKFTMAPTTQHHQLPPTPIEEMYTSTTAAAMDASTIVVSPPISKSSLEERSISPFPPNTPQPTTMYNAYVSPYDLFKTPISSFMHSTSQHRQMVPSILPVGVDPHQLLQGREHAVHDLMQDRCQELSDWEQQQAWMMMMDPQYDDIKSMIELKGLRLANRQKQVKLISDTLLYYGP